MIGTMDVIYMLKILITKRRFKIQLKFVNRGSPLTRGLLSKGYD
jgi:hypothetical protein